LNTTSPAHPGEQNVASRLLLSRDDNLIKQVPLSRERVVLGRRPYCDVVLDDMTVSGEHAVIHTKSGDSVLHDLNSRNGTLVNGTLARQHALVHGDVIDVGVFKLKFVVESFAGEATRMMIAVGSAKIKMLSGKESGQDVALDRAITSIGSSNQIAVVARRRNGYYLTHMEGPTYPLVNGESIGLSAHPLVHDDLIELAGAMFQFIMSADK
jgi:Inner membrane component of T3SS, cytoplasmic domain